MKKITMKDIANIAGVSKATVSMVLNKKDSSIGEETRNKILNICKEYNYVPNSIARSLNTKRTNTIGIILPDITNPYYAEIARAIEDRANDYDFNVILCNSDNNTDKEERYIKFLLSKLVDGVILISGEKGIDNAKVLIDNDIPFVLVDRYVQGFENFNGIYCLNKEGIKEGLNYLYNNKNRKKIVLVTGPMELELSKERFHAYKEFMEENNCYSEHMVFNGDFSLQSGMEVTEQIVQNLKDFDSIFYSNDLMALGGMKVLKRLGYKIPNDVSIMGFDNINICNIVEPELTTIAQPIYRMGRKACKVLINIVNGKGPVEKKIIYYETKLIIRGTT